MKKIQIVIEAEIAEIDSDLLEKVIPNAIKSRFDGTALHITEVNTTE